MRRYILLFCLIIAGYELNAQCLVNSLTINTGYDPITGLAITAGADGGTPVIDPHWTVTAESPGIATAILATGLIEVAPGGNADVIVTDGAWISDPAGIPGGWLSCINSNTYSTDGTGPTGTAYNMKLSRSFRLCSDDSIKLDLYIADDNYVSTTDVDGTLLAFSQASAPASSYFTSFAHFTVTLFLTAGVHTLNVVVNNYNDPEGSPEVNPSGMDIYGTASSATGTNSLVSESFASCATYLCSSVCNAITMPDTLHPCADSSVVIDATLIGTDSVLSISWSPTAYLSDSAILDPTITVPGVSSWYYLTVQSLLPFDYVVNGDFSAGNTGFTSSYTYSAPPSAILVEGDYSVYTNPHGVHTGFTSMGDHTTGTGEMLIANGGPVPTDVWCETIPVIPNTNYNFSAWIANCSSVTVFPNVPIMQFKINGVLIGTPDTITAAPGIWVNFFSVWNSGTSTTASICIYDENTTSSGNDFALDDISFHEICVAKDSVYIQLNPPDTSFASMDTTVCTAGGPITLYAPSGAYSAYLWNTAATTSSITVATGGIYRVYASGNCIAKVDTFHVTYITNPVVSLGSDTSFCIGDSLVLTSVQPAGYTYLWSTGSTGNSITVNATGTYQLTVSNGCSGTDSIHVLVSPYPLVDLGPDTLDCYGIPIALQSSDTYSGAPAYLWSDGAFAAIDTVSLTGTYWLRVTIAGCAAADTINVTILYDTLHLYTPDTAICRGNSVQVLASANPALTYQWTPTAGVPLSTVLEPLITPDTSATYILRASMPMCPDIVDSFYLDVQPMPNVYIGGNRQVCEFDTIHILGWVSPAWYGHYSYSWSPSVYLNDSTESDVVFLAGASTKMVLTVTTPAGCTGVDSADIVVNPGNFASLDTNYSICPHDSVQLVPTGGVSYSWHPGTFLSDSLSSAPWVHGITSLEYVGIATSQYGCLDTVSVRVNVLPAAVIYLGDSVTLYPGQTYQVNTQSNCTYFTWFPPSGLSDPHISSPLASPELSTLYKVQGTTEWGCIAMDSIGIFIDAQSLLALPNAFTPGSGVNSLFSIIRNGNATLNYFRIFNRWGNKVFETTNIDAGWNGEYNGVPQPCDVYVYEVEAVTSTGQVFHKHGNVTLIR